MSQVFPSLSMQPSGNFCTRNSGNFVLLERPSQSKAVGTGGWDPNFLKVILAIGTSFVWQGFAGHQWPPSSCRTTFAGIKAPLFGHPCPRWRQHHRPWSSWSQPGTCSQRFHAVTRESWRNISFTMVRSTISKCWCRYFLSSGHHNHQAFWFSPCTIRQQ